jgi:hypothetical protein
MQMSILLLGSAAGIAGLCRISISYTHVPSGGVSMYHFGTSVHLYI